MKISIILLAVVSFSSASTGLDVKLKKEVIIQQLAGLSSPSGPGSQYVVVNKDTVLFSHSSGLTDIKNKIL